MRTIAGLMLLPVCVAVAWAEAPAPLPVKLFEQRTEGERSPLANVRVLIGSRFATTDSAGVALFEGIPAGSYRLSVEQPDYQRLVQQIQLPEGARQALDLTLTPAATAQWSGRVESVGAGVPVAGVSLVLTPLAVASALSGTAHTVSSWDGRFELNDLPVGRYQLHATAPGYLAYSRALDVVASDNSRQAVYEAPQIDGVALDLCREWGQNCGKPAADLFCRRQGFLEAGDLRVEKDTPPTRIITSNALCESGGCDRISWINCVGDLQQQVLQLQPESTRVAQSLEVVDRVTGRAIAGARVTLAESWPNGVIAEAVSDSAGRLRFPALQIGDANPLDGAGRVQISRRRVTARVEATNYESSVTALTLSATSPPLQVALNPLAAQPEVEPNNDLEQAQQVLTGAPIRFRIGEPGDHDWYKFRLASPARLVAIIEDAPLQTLMQLRDRDGTLLKQQGAYAGKSNRIERWLESGSYSLELSEWGDNAHDAENELTLTLELQPAVDPNEPNQQPEAATQIALNQQVSGLIWPLGDSDYYRIEVTQAGVLRLSDQHQTLQRHVRILSPFGELLAEQGAYENHPLALEYGVTPGVYLVQMLEWGNNHASLEPYRLMVEMVPDDGVVDPVPGAGAITSVRSLAIPQWFASTLLPMGDQDLFAVTLPGAGVLHVQSRGAMQRHLQLFDGSGALLQERGGYENHPVHLDWHAAGPQTLFVSIQEWGNNAWSTQPYSMRVWFEPADEFDFKQRNDDFDNATPLLSGDTLHGSYLPLRDLDFFALEVDFPGVLQVTASSARQTHLRVFDSERRLVAERGAYENQVAELKPEVQAGLYYIVVGEWGDNAASSDPYELKLSLQRAEPGESAPLSGDPPRPLRDGEAQSFMIDQRGDRDRFLFELAEPGEIQLNIASQTQTLVRVFNDQTNQQLHESGHYPPVRWTLPLKFDAPLRLRIELSEWGDNDTSGEPGFVMVDSRARTLYADAIEATPDGSRPERVSFKRLALKHTERAERCELDLNGDGEAELVLKDEQAQSAHFPREGRYLVASRCIGRDGQRSHQRFWVQATGNRAREGIALFLTTPAEGQTLTRPVKLLAQAISYSGRPLGGVRFLLDGALLASDYTAPYDTEVNWQSLAAGVHTLEVVAFDADGVETKLTRHFRLADYFDLSPPDGTRLTGESIRVSWLAPVHGESELRFRKQGSTAWQTVRGQSGRLRTVELNDLEAAVTYEIQPLGGDAQGPVQTLTRVKGLAFGRTRYGANIRRDYDQRVGISVRNNGDEALTVRLECGKPQDPALLVGFVGEGSEDQPINLAPGQVREFLLGISAQDVDTPDHTIPIRIVSENGLSDAAEVAVHVRLPHVELEWQDLGPLPLGHGRRLRLRNSGDTLTDLQVSSAEEQAVRITPTIQHGLLQAGQSIDFDVVPRFYPGFTGVSSRILARGLDRSFDYDYQMRLAEGEQLHRIWLFPGLDPTDPVQRDHEPVLLRNAMRAEQLNPDDVDWSRRDNPEDLDRDGRADRWSMHVDEVRWVGDDTDADGVVDFIHADVGDDGIFEYSALLEAGRWHNTNLVEAWLEMGFSLPWERNSYHPHDTDIVFNDRVIGTLRDVIPEGNYSFRIPPAALRFNKEGLPGDNQVGINSKHLRGGHYVVNSDFRFKFRLTATPVWTVAKSEAAARQAVAGLVGVAISSPDLSISSAEIRLDAPTDTQAGDQITVEIPVHNIGSVAAPGAEVALLRKRPGKSREEIARVTVDDLALHGAATARLNWTATAGSSEFFLIADPEKSLDDLDRVNNEAHFFLPIKGEEIPLKLSFEEPVAGSRQPGSRLTLTAMVNPEAGTVQPSLSIDGGLWQELPPGKERLSAELLLQPGDHRLELRVVEAGGNSATGSVAFKIEASPPQALILAPKAGASIATRHVHVVVAIPERTALVGVRAAGGPWHRAVLAGDEAHVDLPLQYGRQLIEAMVVNQRGVIRLLSQEQHCTVQPNAQEARVAAGAAQRGLVWPDGDADLALDLFEQTNGVLQPVARETARSVLQAGDGDGANTAAMDPGMRQRYEQAARLRAEGGGLQAKGRLTDALERYHKSLRLYPDYRLEAHIKLIEGVMDGSASAGGR